MSDLRGSCCCDDVKGNENESHSQLHTTYKDNQYAVVTMSKVMKMKAIHNHPDLPQRGLRAVVTMSKVMKMKAIHNIFAEAEPLKRAVVTMSKVMKMKAIHNIHRFVFFPALLL